MAGSLFMPFMHNRNDHFDNEGIRLWNDTLQALARVMEKMTPSLSGKDYTYEQWVSEANRESYGFFVSWLKEKGERCLTTICNAELNDVTSEQLLDRFDEAVFELQMAEEVDDKEILAADIADVLVDLSSAIECYEQHDGNTIVFDEDIELNLPESSFEGMDQDESSLSVCEDFFISDVA